MNQVTVNKNKLLEVLKENRAKYQEALDEAKEAYWKEAESKLLDAQAAMERREEIPPFRLSPPPDYTGYYDSAILMLEMEMEDAITLSKLEFDQLVRNQWEWRSQFVNICSSYDHSPKLALSKF